MKKIAIASLILVLTGLNAFTVWAQKTKVNHVPWSINATIYEVNVRQFTKEGTFKALAKQLPRLQKMGVGILWLMPIHPIGEMNRKGTLGSYYSVKDYQKVNPEFGTMDDFKKLVGKAQELGMRVIIDWVANHSAYDNELVTLHPDWYKKDSTGKIIPPVADWTDVAAFDYSNLDLRKYMTESMVFWVREAKIDGFRCDVAGMVPIDFWNKTVPKLKKIKPMFMLAEDETAIMHDTAFDATYSWAVFHTMNKIASGKLSAQKLDSVLACEKVKKFPTDAIRMRFTTNHDENSWNGTEFKRLGEGVKAFTILTFTIPGMPLIYTGQESAMDKSLKFFDKDTIHWGKYPMASFFKTLTGLKKSNPALNAGITGGEMIKVSTTADDQVYAFVRKKASRKVFVITNLSGDEQKVTLQGDAFIGTFKDVFTGKEKKFVKGEEVTLAPWGYFVYSN